jgi:hypothetical protein
VSVVLLHGDEEMIDDERGISRGDSGRPCTADAVPDPKCTHNNDMPKISLTAFADGLFGFQCHSCYRLVIKRYIVGTHDTALFQNRNYLISVMHCVLLTLSICRRGRRLSIDRNPNAWYPVLRM